MVSEKWFDTAEDVTNPNAIVMAHYKYVYDGAGNIVQTLDITNGKVYSYKYEKDALVSAEEFTAVFTNDMVTSKTLVNSIGYRYNDDGKLVEKIVKWKDGQGVSQQQTVSFEYLENGEPIVTFGVGEKGIIFHSKNDTFGRKVFEEMQLGKGFASRQFAYYSGEVTEDHKENAKVKSSPTTQLVKEIVFSDGRTISYEYDKEERITKVTDSLEGVTEYTYDALGQLLTETKNGQLINQMTYDSYGNILSKNNVPYYYDSKWKDLLVRVGDKWIDYDDQGNPIIYMNTHSLCWGKGRELLTFIKCDEDYMEECRCDYTYNANGIRTSKTVGSVRHDYVLEGTKILRETWDNKTLIPLYNSQDEVVGITYNGRLYSFLKNLQGDVIALVDETGETVARYSYDAWGVPTVLEDNTDHQVTSVNPFLYRSYYYDKEIGMYYLQSRYYDPAIGRFINADEAGMILCDKALLAMNIYTYSYNSPVVFDDRLGYGAAIAIPAFVGAYGTSLSGAALVAKLTAYAIAIFPYLFWLIAAMVAVAVVAYIAYQTAYLTSTKTLSNVKAKTTKSKVFKLAYVKGKKLFKVGKALTFVEALTILGVKKAACSLKRRYKVSAKRPKSCKTKDWGMYTSNQSYACALATMLGCASWPEVHGSGYYGHYHDKNHIIHVWFGSPIKYR